MNEDSSILKLFNDDEKRQYQATVEELDKVNSKILEYHKGTLTLSDEELTELRDKSDSLSEEVDRLQNIAFNRLSPMTQEQQDFVDKLSDVAFALNNTDARTLSQRMAETLAAWCCKNAPDKTDIYGYQEGDTLTSYINRIADYLKMSDESVESIIPVRADKIEYPVDKVNSKIWNLIEHTADGQIGIFVGKVAKGKDKGKEAVVTYSINFDGLQDISISKKLTQFDKRVYVAVSALFNAGNRTISLTQIAYAMGYKSTPSDDILKRIYDSILKMNTARIQIDNKQEIEIYKGYVRFDYKGSLLPLEVVTATINGKLTDAAINIFREPPFVTYAKQHKQITTFKVGLLQSPLKKTESNLCLEDYIIEQIALMKSGTRNSRRMLFDTIYENCHITGKQRQRTPPKIDELLKYYKEEQKYIKGYAIDKVGVDIIL